MGLKKKAFIAIFFSLLMLLSSLFLFGGGVTQQSNLNGNGNSYSVLTHISPVVEKTSVTTGHTPWTFPTNTSEEPGYTGGTYISGLAGPPLDLNPYTANTIIDGTVYGDVYMSLYQTFLNGSLGPALATGYSLTMVPSTANHTTYDLESQQYVNYSAIYTVY